MKATDWKAAFEELASKAELDAEARGAYMTAHIREVPEGLATRLRRAANEVAVSDGLRGLEYLDEVLSQATTEACAALDADAEAMRVRREVEAHGDFASVTILWDETAVLELDEACGLQVTHFEGEADAAYRAAHEALRKAGKL